MKKEIDETEATEGKGGLCPHSAIAGLGIGIILTVLLFTVVLPAMPHYTWSPDSEQAFEIYEQWAEVPVNRTQVNFFTDTDRAVVSLSTQHQGKNLSMIFVVPSDWERTTRIIQGNYTAIIETDEYTAIVDFSINETFSQINIHPDRIDQYSRHLEEISTDGIISWRATWEWRKTLWTVGGN